MIGSQWSKVLFENSRNKPPCGPFDLKTAYLRLPPTFTRTRPCLASETRGDSSRNSWPTTTNSACTVRSATSHRRTTWPVATGRSSPSGTPSWMGTPAEESRTRGESAGGLIAAESLPESFGGTMIDDDLGGDRAPWRHDASADPGAKTEGSGTMPPCLSPSGLAPKRQIDPHLFPCALCLISQPRFPHFTLNHYTCEPSSNPTLESSATTGVLKNTCQCPCNSREAI